MFGEIGACSGRNVREPPFDISRRGLEKMKKNVCRHKSQKKSLLKMWAEKKIIVEIDEKYVDQKNHQMVTYIIASPW